MTARYVTGFFSASEFGNFLHILGRNSLLNYTETWRKGKIHWRKFKKIQWRRRPRNYRFLSLVVAEHVLIKTTQKIAQESGLFSASPFCQARNLHTVENTMGAGMITQLIPQQLLLCNWCACNWILIPPALWLCNCLSVTKRGKTNRHQRCTRIT